MTTLCIFVPPSTCNQRLTCNSSSPPLKHEKIRALCGTGCICNIILNLFHTPVEHARETREWWPLLTVETEANGDLWSTNERGPSLFGVWARFAGTKDFYPAEPALVSPVQKCFLPHPHTFSLYVAPSPSNLGRQSCRVACLLICVSGTYTNSQISPQSSDPIWAKPISLLTLLNSALISSNLLVLPQILHFLYYLRTRKMSATVS